MTHPAPAPAPPAGPEPPINTLLRALVTLGGSDLHVSAERAPQFRVHGELRVVEPYGVLSAKDVEALLLQITPEGNAAQLKEVLDTDFAHTVPNLGRFRVNLFRQLNGLSSVFRQIPSVIPTAKDLNLPPALIKMSDLHRGLVLVTGPTGSGKSTTLAAMIHHINAARTDHILTVEDPIEFVHTPIKAHINQRELNTHAHSFDRALRAALREDPDVILVGELRDLETMELATTAAETGHLVFGTLHTNSAPKTLDRLISSFPGDKQAQIRTQLSETLKGVVSQQLLRRRDGKGRVAAFEVMVTTAAIANLIREGKPSSNLVSAMETGAADGMITMDRSLAALAKKNVISYEDAMSAAIDPKAVDRFYKGADAVSGGARAV